MTDVNVNFPPTASPNRSVTAGDVESMVTQVKADVEGQVSVVTAQLADTVSITENIKIKGVDLSGYGKKQKTLVTFVSDDGQDTDYTILKPIFEAEGVPCCMAVTTGFTGKPYFDKPIPDAHGLELQAMGWEICGHTHNHPALASGLTEEEVEYQFTENNRILRERGYKVNNLMYPHGSNNRMVRRIARKYYRSACTYGSYGTIDTPPFNMFNINRVGLGAWFDAGVDNPTKYPAGTRNTFNTYYKPRVDEAIEKGGWLIFGLHSNAPEFDATQQEYLRQTIQYVKSQGVPIVTMNEGLDLIGNVIDVDGYNEDDTEEKYFRVGSNGIVSTNSAVDAIDVVLPNNAVDSNSPLSSFEMGKITYCFTNSGMLITDYKYNDWAWQMLKKQNGTIDIRSIQYPAMTWSAWDTIFTLSKIGQKKSWYRTTVTVTASSTLDHKVVGFRVPDASHIVVGSPYSGLPNGLSYYIYVGSEATGDNVHIKFINSTTADVPVNVEWLLRSLQY